MNDEMGAELDALERFARAEAACFAAQAEILAELDRLARRAHVVDAVERFLALDVAGTLRVGQLGATHRLMDAVRLMHVLPATLAALRAGRLLLAQAELVMRETSACSERVAGEVDPRLHARPADELAGLTGRRLTDRLRRLVLAVESTLEPREREERERTARADRRVVVRPEPDGMSSLWALLLAEQALRFAAGLDELTHRQALADQLTGVVRSTDQRRATSSPPCPPSPSPPCSAGWTPPGRVWDPPRATPPGPAACRGRPSRPTRRPARGGGQGG